MMQAGQRSGTECTISPSDRNRMNNWEAGVSIQDLIASKSASLTQTDRRIAQVVLGNPTQIAFSTVADLARQARTSRPSVVRFAMKLGFEGYSELQAWIREEVARQLAIPSLRIRRREPQGLIRGDIEKSVAAAFEALADARIGTLTAPVIAARNVWILSGETSMAGAYVLHSGLSMLRPGVHLVLEHSAGRDLCGASAEDAAVIFDFARYRKTPITAAKALTEMGVQLVAITDGPLSPLATLTPNWCALKIPAVGPFDSAVPPVIAAELLVARIAFELGDAARERIDRLESLWQRIETFLEYMPRHERFGHSGDRATENW
ncbi:MAG: MurR/RpiR family transcriptional regulator [Phycisphaeraceae bacterium]|nr:MurR/RpiR family transcriptional regulator [Phycisphaeraceae bacterium]